MRSYLFTTSCRYKTFLPVLDGLRFSATELITGTWVIETSLPPDELYEKMTAALPAENIILIPITRNQLEASLLPEDVREFFSHFQIA